MKFEYYFIIVLFDGLLLNIKILLLEDYKIIEYKSRWSYRVNKYTIEELWFRILYVVLSRLYILG